MNQQYQWPTTVAQMKVLAAELIRAAEIMGGDDEESHDVELVLAVAPAATVQDDDGDWNAKPILTVRLEEYPEEGVYPVDPYDPTGGRIDAPTPPASAQDDAKDERSDTYGMNLGERIAHVGGRTNAQGYTEFGSPMAVNALIQHVLRDLDWTRQDDDGAYQARYRLPGGQWSSWGHVVCGVKGHEQELRYLPGARRPAAPAAGDARAPAINIEAAAKALAECMDYPWAHMPEQGRATMREHAQTVIRAASQQQEG